MAADPKGMEAVQMSPHESNPIKDSALPAEAAPPAEGAPPLGPEIPKDAAVIEDVMVSQNSMPVSGTREPLKKQDSAPVALLMMSSADGSQLMRAASAVMLTTKKEIIPFTTFLIIGCVQLYGWNSLLNGLPGVVETVFNVKDFSDTVTATYSTVLFLLTVVFTKVNVASLLTLYIGLFVSAIVALLFALIVQLSNAHDSSPLMHTLAGGLAVAAAIIGSSAFGFAARFPANYSGAASAGLGLAGVATFVVWMICSHGIFESTVSGIRASVWVLTAVAVIFALVGFALAFYLFNRKDVKAYMAYQDKPDLERREGEELGTYEEEGVKGVLKRGAALAVGYFFTLYVSLICFPIIGPLNWSRNGLERDILVGIFQVGDLIGRYAPNYLSWLRLNKTLLLVLTAARALFVVIFMLSSRFPDAAVLGSMWFLVLEQLALSLTNGWFCTLYFLKMPEQVKGDEAKVRIASFCLLAGFVGIAGGQWTGKGFVSIP